MTIQLQIPDDVAEGLTRLSQASGESPEEIALSAIRRRVSPFAKLDQLMAPSYAAMNFAGITEDEAIEIFEAEKHAMRAERAAANK